MASTALTRTPSSAGNRKTWTFSAWFKRSKIGSGQGLFVAGSSGGNEGTIRFESDKIDWQEYNASNTTTEGQLITNQLLRDTSAWYHLVCAWDSTNATAGDRMKMYLNGEEVTSFATDNNPPLNYDSEINTNDIHNIGRQSWNNSAYFDGSMSHIHFIDGTAYTPSAFGEYDANGVWKIKTSPSVTYGNNGFFILKDGNSVTDQSGNSNNWTVGAGTLTNTEDNPSNVFATWNPLVITSAGGVAVRTPAFQNGNTTALFDDNGNNEFAFSTLAPSKGKYYAEFKWVNATGNGASSVGIVKSDFVIQTDVNDQGVVYKGDGNKVVNNSSSSYGASWTTGDIIGIALDCDSNTVNFYKNNAPQGSISIDADTNWYMFCSSYALSSVTRSVNANFGNGYFGTSAISSAGTNASGIGIFEFDVPTGYTALSTKGLNL